jgi:hypothetical protein
MKGMEPSARRTEPETEGARKIHAGSALVMPHRKGIG